MSALCQKQTSTDLFNHLVGAAKQREGYAQVSLHTALQFSPKSVQPVNFLCLAVVSDLPTSMTLIG
jgi:hypothetical protein